MAEEMRMEDTFNPSAAFAAGGEGVVPSEQHTSSDESDRSSPMSESATPLDHREFLKKTKLVGDDLVVAPWLLTDGSANIFGQPAAGARPAGVETVAVRLRVNGSSYGLRLDPRTSLLDLLREQLDLTGTKKGCNHGQCGACTVLVDGRRINSCLALAVIYDGSEITTVEGLAKGDELHPLQAAFIRHEGFQCGYCTSGQICSAVGMLREVEQGTASHVTPDVRREGSVELTDEEIRERMSGNICRCGAYPGIVAAVREASGSSQRGA
jgi:xanthine dehydrogenase YagT iron-sulfur-binding subunit